MADIGCNPCESARQKRYWPHMCAWLAVKARNPNA